MDESAMFAAFMRLHDGLEREAPGSREATRRALALSGARGPVSVAEMGCGPGAAVAALLDLLPEAHVTGLDLHAPYLAAAARRADALGQGHRFTGVIGDMGAPPLSGPFDLIWSEGAIYSVGVAEGLRVWRDLLKPGGVVAFSDAVWLTGDPDPRARAVFEDYEGMGDMAALRAKVEAAGLTPVGAFEFGAAEWDAYYLPLAARCDLLEAELSATPEGAEVLRLTREEIAARGACGRDYAYVFIVAKKP